MASKEETTFSARIKRILWFWPFFLMAAVLLVLSGVCFIDDINIKLDKKMTCTVESTKVASETYSIGNSNGTRDAVVVKSKDCRDLMFTQMPDGVVGTDDLQHRLKSGHKYTFVYEYIRPPMDATKAYSFTEA